MENKDTVEHVEKQETRKDILEERVNHPSHYGGENNPYEVIKIIEAWNSDFYIGNVIKYSLRAGRGKSCKELEIQDLKKAVWYLNRKISKLEGNT